MNSEIGKWLVIAGIIAVVAGIIIYFFHDKLNWIGHLPGDINFKKDNVRFYFPITTLIIINLIIFIIIYILRRFNQ